MKIAYFCNEINLRNGWCVINYNTINEALKNGYEVIAILERGGECSIVSPKLRVERILSPPEQMKKKIWLFPVQLIQIWWTLKRNKIDIVHILVEPYLIYFAFIRVKKLLITLVGTYSISIFFDSTMKLVYRLALKRITTFLSISDYTTKVFRKKVDPKIAVQLIRLGVDLNKCSHPIVKREDKKNQFCLVGQIKERKGVFVAIEAIRILSQDFPNVMLVIVGGDSNEYAKRCKDLVEKLELLNNVVFTGFQPISKVVEIYANSLANVLPSFNSSGGSFEGFGLIHLEANACGVPTIGSLETGNETAIVDGISGFLAPQNDPDTLAKIMRRILSLSPKDYDKLCRTSREHAERNSWGQYFSDLDKIYRGLN